MKGDFSRYGFRTRENYIAVLKQQGRIDLDSDWNEQVEILNLHHRQLICDVLGHLAVPLSPNDITSDNSGAFKIDNFSSRAGGVIDFSIGRGLIYAGGYPCRLNEDMTFRTQTDYPEPEPPAGPGDILVYIEVWAKTVSYIDDESIREPALGGPDTCLRKKLVVQVKTLRVPEEIREPGEAFAFLKETFREGNLRLTLKIEESAHQIPIAFGEVDLEGGLIPGNLHLRIELHRGVGRNGGYSEGFKWSDENAATVVKILQLIGDDSAIVEEVEAVTGESMKEGDWVEVSNHITEHHRQGGQMARIKSLTQDESGLRVTIDAAIHPLLRRLKTGNKTGPKLELVPRLRRWSGYISPLSTKTVFDLGGGIKTTFHVDGDKSEFRPGDYWTFPIRDKAYNERFAPNKSKPDGVRTIRHPLAIIKSGGKKKTVEIIDCRRFFKPAAAFA